MPDKSKSKPKNKPAAPFLSESSEVCFKHFSKIVTESPPAELEVWNADAEIVRVNVTRGVDAIRPHKDHITKALPLVSMDKLLELPSLALALGFAANKVSSPASPQDIKARQQRLRPVRSQTLRYLEIAAELGLVPADRVKSIRADQGAVDEARDAVAIVALFNERAAELKNKHPFTKASLEQLADDGNWLLAQLLPKGATPQKAAQNDDALVRDRLWTELVARYDDLYQAGVAVWGRRGVDEHIPSLLSRAAASKAKDKGDPATGSTGNP